MFPRMFPLTAKWLLLFISFLMQLLWYWDNKILASSTYLFQLQKELKIMQKISSHYFFRKRNQFGLPVLRKLAIHCWSRNLLPWMHCFRVILSGTCWVNSGDPEPFIAGKGILLYVAFTCWVRAWGGLPTRSLSYNEDMSIIKTVDTGVFCCSVVVVAYSLLVLTDIDGQSSGK